MLSTADIHWGAGFLDGEGSFNQHGSTVGITAVQKDKWPLEKMQRLFGGAVRQYSRPDGRAYWHWTAYGRRAAGLMMTFFSLLSPRRQTRIEGLLKTWVAQGLRGSHNRNKMHCKRGHEFTEANTYLKPAGGRQCRICQDIHRGN